jgi:PAS domain S-box-containing protein
MTGSVQPFEKEYFRKDGVRVPVLVGAASLENGAYGVAFVLDLTERKRAEAILRERDATVRGLFDANIIGTFTWRLDKAGGTGFRPVFQDFNDAFLRIVGYDREDIATGTSTWILTPPEWVDRTQRAADEMKLYGAFQPYEKEFLRKDGSRVPVLVGAAQTGDTGIAFVLDLTEQKRAEAVLRESEARVRHLIDANIIGIFIGDFDGNIVDANDTYLRLLGYDREDLLAGRLNWANITPPELLYRSERALQEMKSVGKARLYEKEYIRKDGSRVPALVGATIFGEGRGLGFVLDLTEQKRAEAALRESEEQWKAVFENNPTMYFMVDPDGMILSVNSFGAGQLGYRVDELILRPLRILVHDADLEYALRNKARCLEQMGLTLSWELRKVRKSGEVIWVRETARAMLIKNRPVVLIVCEDITEGKRAADALREVQAELAHANRLAAMGQLTASIAHEVNQPIGAMVTDAQAALRFLEGRSPNLEEVRDALASIVKGGFRAGDVINRIRALVKKAPPRTESVDMNEAIREVIVVTRGEAAKHGISVEARLSQGLPLIRGDRVQLQQVVLNLILNAIEAMSVEDSRSRTLSIGTERGDPDNVLVAVRDSGPGIDPERVERLFESFYTTKASGMGMGLSICRSIVEAHGGQLWANANQPHGAVFLFTLPAQKTAS